MKSNKTDDLKKRILAGIELAFIKLLKDKSRDDAELIFSKNGKIIKIKARDIIKNT